MTDWSERDPAQPHVGTDDRRLRLRRLRTDELTPDEVAAIRAIMAAAFGTDPEERFTDDDWYHAVNSVHFVLDVDGEIRAHASVVERELQLGGRPIRTGYVSCGLSAYSR